MLEKIKKDLLKVVAMLEIKDDFDIVELLRYVLIDIETFTTDRGL